MKKFNLISLGADPEFFIKKGNDYFPPFLFTKGDKDTPEVIERNPEYSILVDNMTIEGNIPPAYSSEEFVNNMNTLIDILKTRIEIRKGFTLEHESSVRFKPRFLNNPKSREIGCAPDLNSFYTFNPNFRIMDLEQKMVLPYRAAGFHIHIGYNVEDFHSAEKAVWDKVITQLFEILVVDEFEQRMKGDEDNHYRKIMYGRGDFFGYYRPKKYGVECRGLGGYFTRPEFINDIWDKVNDIFEYLNTCENPISLLANGLKKEYNSLEELKTYYTALNRNLEEKLNKKVYA